MRYFLFVILVLFSCSRQPVNDFFIHKEIWLRPADYPKDRLADHYGYDYDLYHKTDREILSELAANNFEKWILPGDTIKLYKGPSDIGNIDLWFVAADSIYEISKENAIPSTFK
jgi:hypothetical protein